jgi:uncharacterized SAM-binding protein YcdF (DUF218 family)
MDEIDRLARIIWNYHLMHHALEKADIMVVLGSNDVRVAKYAAHLFLDDWAPLLVASGGYGVLTKDLYNKPEAELFADIAVEAGVPREKILVEGQSTNTGQNFMLTAELLASKGIMINRAIVIQKPYMERRTYATGRKFWPGVELIVTSPPIAYEDYPNQTISKDLMINIMVGDLQRIREYPAKGFQITQDMPDEVWAAAQKLINLGYNKHLISN